MSRSTCRSLFSGRRAAAALLVQASILLPVVAGAVPSAHAARPAPSAASVDCGLQLLARNDTGPLSDVRVALPDRLAGVDLLPSAFSLVQSDELVPITVRRRPAAEQGVAVVLASSSTTSPARYDAARAAALTLLDSLPPGTRTAVGTTAQSPLSPLSPDRARATRALVAARAGAGASAVTAVERTARQLPADADVVLFTDGAEEGTGRQVQELSRRLQERGVVLTRVVYAGASSIDRTDGWAASASQRACAAAAASAPLSRQVERVQAVLEDQYRISAPLAPAAPATLSVRAAGTTSSIRLPPVDEGTAPSNPYRPSAPWGATAVLSLVAAGELAVLGVLLLVRPRRRRRSAVGGRLGVDPPPAAVETGDERHRVGVGASADR